MADESQASAVAHVLMHVARWLETRLGVDAPTARFAARSLAEIMWPYVLNDAYVQMARGLREAGLEEFADQVEEVRHRVLDQHMQEDACSGQPDAPTAGSTPTR